MLHPQANRATDNNEFQKTEQYNNTWNNCTSPAVGTSSTTRLLLQTAPDWLQVLDAKVQNKQNKGHARQQCQVNMAQTSFASLLSRIKPSLQQCYSLAAAAHTLLG